MKRMRSESLQAGARQQQKQSKKEKEGPKQVNKIVLQNKLKGNFTQAMLKQQVLLQRKYFRSEVVQLAKSLLGKVMVHESEKGVMKAIIVETQAYKAPLDKACHAYNNKKTQRTKYFWLDGGHLYIYTIYMPTNICLNVVAGLENQPEAVLIRAVQPIVGIDVMRNARNIKSKKDQDLCNGPGKVGKSLGVDKDIMNGRDLTQGTFRIVDAGIKDFQIQTSKRINIDYAAQWTEKMWRFFIKGNSFVSKGK